MPALPDARTFAAGVQSVRGEEPLLIGLIGPPGGGKTVSALRLATGMRAVRPGPVVLIDTEGGRSKKYSPGPGQAADPKRFMFDFLRVEMTPPFRSHDFLAAIQAQLRLSPAAIIVDCCSDEHEGEGGYLAWHDEIASLGRGERGNVGGNEWAAWAVPKAARKRLISGLLQVKVPMLFTFRAREKTVTEPGKNGGKDKIVNIEWMPVAPLEIVHTLDLTCILPPRADGVPVWSSEKAGEDFIVKLPHFLAPLIQAGQLSEDTGEALARWAKGDSPAIAQKPPQDGRSGQEAAAVAADRQRAGKGQPDANAGLLAEIRELLATIPQERRSTEVQLAFGVAGDWGIIKALDAQALTIGLAALRRNLNPLAAMADEPPAERMPGED